MKDSKLSKEIESLKRFSRRLLPSLEDSKANFEVCYTWNVDGVIKEGRTYTAGRLGWVISYYGENASLYRVELDPEFVCIGDEYSDGKLSIRGLKTFGVPLVNLRYQK